MDTHDSPWRFLLLELGVGSFIGHYAHALAQIPPWIGGAVSALVVGITLRVLDSLLKRIGERLAARIAARLDADASTPSTSPSHPKDSQTP